MKKIIRSLFIVAALALVPALAQAQQAVTGQYGTNTIIASYYGQWNTAVTQSPVLPSNWGLAAGGGTYTLNVANGAWATTQPGGVPFQAITTSTPILVGSAAAGDQETVTPSSVSGCTLVYTSPVGCSFTATFTYGHGPGTPLRSADFGIAEAINDVGLHGGGNVYWVIDPGQVTLNTGGATTSAGSVNIPTRSTITVATARVNITITGCSGGWSLGITGGTGTDFTAANTTLTAGTTTDSSTLSTPVTKSVAAALPTIFCTTANATAGAVHPHYEGIKQVAPQS